MFFVSVPKKINPQNYLWLIVNRICPNSISIQSEIPIQSNSKIFYEVNRENI
jgi:hypothetical protein